MFELKYKRANIISILQCLNLSFTLLPWKDKKKTFKIIFKVNQIKRKIFASSIDSHTQENKRIKRNRVCTHRV